MATKTNSSLKKTTPSPVPPVGISPMVSNRVVTGDRAFTLTLLDGAYQLTDPIRRYFADLATLNGEMAYEKVMEFLLLLAFQFRQDGSLPIGVNQKSAQALFGSLWMDLGQMPLRVQVKLGGTQGEDVLQRDIAVSFFEKMEPVNPVPLEDSEEKQEQPARGVFSIRCHKNRWQQILASCNEMLHIFPCSGNNAANQRYLIANPGSLQD